jgi:hypothetical protein
MTEIQIQGINIRDINAHKYFEKYILQDKNTIDLISTYRTRHKENVAAVENNHNINADIKAIYMEVFQVLSDFVEAQADAYTPRKALSKADKFFMISTWKGEFMYFEERYAKDIKELPLPKTVIRQNTLQYIENQILPQYEDISAAVIRGKMIDDFVKVAELVGIIDFVQALYTEQENEATAEQSTVIENNSPIKWVAKTTHLAYIMKQLAELGYIEAPKRLNREINNREFARQIIKAFDFEGNGDKVTYLAKELGDDNHMSNDNKDMFVIPHVVDLK